MSDLRTHSDDARAGVPLWFGSADGFVRAGTVTATSAGHVHVRMPGLTLGAAVSVERADGSVALAEVVRVDEREAVCAAVTDLAGVMRGTRATSTHSRIGAYVGTALLGCDTDAWGRCANAKHAVVASPVRPPIERRPITRALETGIPAIDAFATLGYGQRMALVAGAGVGKSTLLRQLAERAAVDANVIALIGERGREATELIAGLRATEKNANVTTVCATAEASPHERLCAVRTATAHAETLADEGRDVLLVVDSLTRVAAAWRELAVARGEALAYRGHPPSLPSLLAQIVERAGVRSSGSVTAIYAVLVDGDDLTEPVTDSVRALVDGHIVLSRRAAQAGRFPPIDVLRSLSRLMSVTAGPEHCGYAASVRSALATLEECEDLFAIGAYKPGADRLLDAAVAARRRIDALIFSGDRSMPLAQTLQELTEIARCVNVES